MARHFTRDDKDEDKRNSKGERLFWSDRDGDGDPKHNQTAYREHKGIFGWCNKIKNDRTAKTSKSDPAQKNRDARREIFQE